MILLQKLSRLLFPPKCVLCGRLLSEDQTDLCGECRSTAEEFRSRKGHNSFVARCVILWYYKDKVRESLLRYKFGGRESYGDSYARLLAMRLLREDDCYDLVTWVPISRSRKLRRGYDQVELIARPLAAELGLSAVPTLKKVRKTRTQSTITGLAARRANVLNAYRVLNPEQVSGKKILLLDDIITTGATIQECQRTLLYAGAAEVICAAVAGSDTHSDKQQ